MKINYENGEYFSGDRKILIKTDREVNEGGEPITIFKLALLINQLGINELKRKNNTNMKRFLYRDFLLGVLDQTKRGIDWAEPINQNEVIRICKNHHLKEQKIDYDLLRRTTQRKLEEYRKHPEELENKEKLEEEN